MRQQILTRTTTSQSDIQRLISLQEGLMRENFKTKGDKQIIKKSVAFMIDPQQQKGKILITRDQNNQIIGRSSMIFHEKHSILMALGYLDKNMRNKSVYHNGFKFFYEVAQKTGKKEILGFIIFQGPQFFKVFKNSFWKATPYFIYQLVDKEKKILKEESKGQVREIIYSKEHLKDMIDILKGDSNKYISLGFFNKNGILKGYCQYFTSFEQKVASTILYISDFYVKEQSEKAWMFKQFYSWIERKQQIYSVRIMTRLIDSQVHQIHNKFEFLPLHVISHKIVYKNRSKL